MEGRKLDVTVRSPHRLVREKRDKFNLHIDHCQVCQPSLCWQGQMLWRSLCLEALRLHGRTPADVDGA